MAIEVIWASPNQDGLTAAAKSKILEGIDAAGMDADILNLNDLTIQRCLTCGSGFGPCWNEGKCVLRDDFQTVYDKLARADGIIWVTPVYWFDLPESLKSFLDRLRRSETAHNHWLKGKKCMLVACAGGSGRGAVECLNKLETTLGHMDMRAVDRLPIIQFNREYMLPALSSAGEVFARHLQKQ